MENLWKMEIEAAAADYDAITGYLFGRISYGWEEEKRGEMTLLRVHVEEVHHAEQMRQEIAARWPDATVRGDAVPNKNWMLAWREFFSPVPIGQTFIVLAPWMIDDNPYPNRIPIIIDPKTAFGTGHHPTTSLCMGLVARLHEAGRLDPSMRFLDLGTGTGILGFGCARLGMSGLGLDIDPLAIDNALENRDFNDIEGDFELRTGSVDDADGTFDLVLANILAGPLKVMAPKIVKKVAPGGCLALSGILSEQAEDVADCYRAAGLGDPVIVNEAEWAGLVWENCS